MTYLNFISFHMRCEKSVACRVTEEGFVVNPSDWLAVRAECVTECGDRKLRYDWELYAVSDTSQEAVTLQDWRNHVISNSCLRRFINAVYSKLSCLMWLVISNSFLNQYISTVDSKLSAYCGMSLVTASLADSWEYTALLNWRQKLLLMNLKVK
ncbi:hypothetical protein AVEN_243269-1 [Araneus ventricosus]|uniref:Uncharacterized protein n=1 Tax=Araneus ventricosus TaxID=182803 RepID=A0A4Y2M861_ARAVE|nr:hypothetical protein AVEN_243269-1 [Araneus ventricosus]